MYFSYVATYVYMLLLFKIIKAFNGNWMLFCPLLSMSIAGCEITFEMWDDILQGHDKVYTDIRGIIWTLYKQLTAFVSLCFQFTKHSPGHFYHTNLNILWQTVFFTKKRPLSCCYFVLYNWIVSHIFFVCIFMIPICSFKSVMLNLVCLVIFLPTVWMIDLENLLQSQAIYTGMQVILYLCSMGIATGIQCCCVIHSYFTGDLNEMW